MQNWSFFVSFLDFNEFYTNARVSFRSQFFLSVLALVGVNTDPYISIMHLSLVLKSVTYLRQLERERERGKQ